MLVALDDNRENHVLDRELNDRRELQITKLPSVMINGKLEHGGITAEAVLQTICYAFSSKPRVCKELSSRMGCTAGSYSIQWSLTVEGVSEADFSAITDELRSSLAIRTRVCDAAVAILSHKASAEDG